MKLILISIKERFFIMLNKITLFLNIFNIEEGFFFSVSKTGNNKIENTLFIPNHLPGFDDEVRVFINNKKNFIIYLSKNNVRVGYVE